MNLNSNYTKAMPSYAQNRPAPIRIPPPIEDHQAVGNPGGVQSPRAALVAGLRSATDRRRQQQQQQQAGSQYHTIQAHMSPPGSPSPIQPPTSKPGHHRVSSSSSSSSSSVYSQQYPHQSPQLPSSSLAADSARIYAALQVKQQELLATSMLISQQQQRIQQAMNSAAAVYASSGSQPSTPTAFSTGFDSYMDPLAGSMAHLSSNDIFLQPPTPTGSSLHRSSGIFGSQSGSYYDVDPLCPPSFGTLRPSSPSLPVRPSSSASNRGSLFFDTHGPQPSGQSRFKRGHRKASSLSMVNRSGSPSSNVGVIGTGLNGVSRGSQPPRPAHSAAEIPVRQPIGPPSTDELLAHPDRNFARRYSSTQVVADSRY
ncbi:hypothetical protein TRVA0_003S02476 [Trichomonascus vanleenenianus]|uniref:uncharacterized protein n=1 Tax=Trichomonascus vanleenenianus TaxID=2268995 RepID=UPI003EC9CF18